MDPRGAGREPGGIARLLTLLDDPQAQEALEYDLLGLGVDLGDLYTGELSVRRLRLLVRGLPPDARLTRLLRRRGRESGDLVPTPIEELPPDVWSDQMWLLAEIHDAIAHQSWLFVCAHTGRDDPRPSAPAPMPRPTGIPRRRRTVGAWFAAAGVAARPPPQH